VFSLLISLCIYRYGYLECYGFDVFFSSMLMLYAFFLISCPLYIFLCRYVAMSYDHGGTSSDFLLFC